MACSEDVEVSWMSRSKRLPPKRGLNCLLIIFLLMIIGLVIAVGVLAHRLKQRREEDGSCRSPECSILAGEMLSRMDLGADPCQDFYQYACGRYSRPENRPPDKGYISTFGIPSDLTNQQLAALLASPGDEYRGRRSSAVFKVKQFYAACMNDAADDEKGRKILKDLIRTLKSWPLDSWNWNATTWSAQEALAEAQNLNFVALFTVGLINDPRDSNTNILGIAASGLLLQQPEYYKIPGAESAYKNYMETLLTLIYGTGNEALYRDYAQKIWSFEKSLAEITPSSLEILAVHSPSAVTTFSEIQKKIEFLNLTTLVNQALEGSGASINTSTELLVGTERYFESLNRIIKNLGTESKEILATYIVWIAVQKLSSQAGKSFKAALETFSGKMLGGNPSTPAKWKTCIGQTTEVLGFAVGAVYAEKYFEAEDRDKISKFLQITVDEFIRRLPEVEWLKEETRKKAEEKARGVYWQIGYPEVFNDAEKLDEFYKDFTVSSTVVENALEARRFQHILGVRKYGQVVDKKEWLKMPTETNAYYYPPSNQIVVLGGILHQPMYDRNFPLSIFYGGMGSVLAHELLHGFDNTGRNYDLDGRVVDWWDTTSAAAYQNRAQCFSDQYGKETFQGFSVNGNLTLGENIADSGGIKLSYRAYTRAASGDGDGLIDHSLSGLNMTGAQQFFLAYAQLWCTNVDRSIAARLVVEDNHAPSPLRVNVVLKNTPQFSQTFNCPQTAAMNPRERCTLW